MIEQLSQASRDFGSMLTIATLDSASAAGLEPTINASKHRMSLPCTTVVGLVGRCAERSRLAAQRTSDETGCVPGTPDTLQFDDSIG
jgi:hypothetical protein